MAARGETQADVEVSTLVVPAWRLRWRAPELALVLGERALAFASSRHDEAERLRAEALVVFAGNRVGRGVRIADRALDALKAAEAAGEYETAWMLRVELAACARSVGAPLTGFAAVTPVLEAPDVPAELRASALVQASECLVTVGRGDEPTRALQEADQLYVADTTLDEDMRLVLRGLIRAVQAAQHRRWGDIAAAIGAAREGLDLLSRLIDTSADSGQAHGRLTLELALALMDANRLLDASEIGTPMLERPVRAPSASTSGWLRLALATRVHLPAGRVPLARDMLRDAAVSAERHQLDTLLAESLLALAHVHEVSGELADALTNLRAAHAAERRRARAVYAVRARLAAEFSGVHRQPADLHQQLADLLRPIEGMPRPTDGVLPAALKQQLRQWRPVQVRKGDGLKVKRVRRAAEDMTVEGLSAARAHAADRWRMVQPFGEPEDKTPTPIEPPPPPPSDRTVPASGLIASAGAMVSGRRRAARVAAGEIDDEPVPTPTAISAEPPAAQPTPEQARRRKVEEQLMELQREARRQIEAERQARAEERAKAEREAQAAAEEAARAEAARQEVARQEAARQEAARQEAARQEAARLEATRQEAARQEAARQETARQEAARQEAARQEAARQEAARQEAARLEAAREEAARQETAREEAARQEFARHAAEREAATREEAFRREAHLHDSRHAEAARTEAAHTEAARPETSRAGSPSGAQSESVLDMLKAQGLRAGGRRRAKDAETPVPATESESPSWRVDPPSRLRHEAASSSQSYFADPADATSQPPFRDEPGSTTPSAPPQNYFADSHPATPDRPNYFADPSTAASPDLPDRQSRSGRSGLAAAFSRPPAAPDFGPHFDDPAPAFGEPASTEPASPFGTSNLGSSTFGAPQSEPSSAFDRPNSDFSGPAEPAPAYPLSTPAAGFPSVPAPSEPKLPDLDFSSLDFSNLTGTGSADSSSKWSTASIPSPEPAERPGPAQPSPSTPAPDREPEPKPLPPIPDPVPSVPIPDEIPQTPEPDLLSSTFLSSADVEDDTADLPTGPVKIFPAPQPAAGEPRTEPDSAADRQQEALDAPSESDGDSGTGASRERPSSRRKPSDLSLADLLAEALVAYETGRRSDEEQLEAPDLTVPEWSAAGTDRSAAERPSNAEQSFTPDQRSAADLPPVPDLTSPSEPAPSYEAASPYQTASPYELGSSYQPASPFHSTADQPLATEPQAPETAAEKTGPIVPVGAAPDSETTGPIRRVPSDGGPGWTLPGT